MGTFSPFSMFFTLNGHFAIVNLFSWSSIHFRIFLPQWQYSETSKLRISAISTLKKKKVPLAKRCNNFLEMKEVGIGFVFHFLKFPEFQNCGFEISSIFFRAFSLDSNSTIAASKALQFSFKNPNLSCDF